MNPVLELSMITCRFDDGGAVVTALNDVSLTITEGQLVAVVGPSGSGKSTLVHVACGLVVPSSGVVRILGQRAPGEGRRIARTFGVGETAARAWWARQRRESLGVVHQRLNLVPALSAIDNVALPLRLQGHTRGSARVAAAEALSEVDARDLAEARIDRLSTGEQQRVALARATVGGRRLVLADEPTAALDTVGAERVAQLLARLADAGRAVLMVTHDSRLATWADHVVVLRDGRVIDRVGSDPVGTTAIEATTTDVVGA